MPTATRTDPLEVIRARCRTDGRSQSDIAFRAGITLNMMSTFMNYKRPGISFATVARIVAALGMRWSDLDSDQNPD